MCILGDMPPPWGGLAKSIIFNADFLVKQGHEVHVVVEGEKPYTIFDGIRVYSIPPLFDGLPRNFLLKWIYSFFIFLGLCLKMFLHGLGGISAVYRIVEHAGEGNLKDKLRRLIYRLYYLDKLLRLHRKHRFGLVHVHHTMATRSLCGILAGKILRIPVVVSSYGETIFWSERGKNLAKLRGGLIKYVLKTASKVISPSRHCGEGALNYGVPAEKLEVIYSGVDTDLINPKVDGNWLADKWQLKNKKVVLFVGQLDWRKGPHHLIRSAPFIIKEVPNVSFVLVGPDLGMEENLRRLSERLGVEDHIIFAGSVDEKALAAYYAICDVLVFPSLTKRECMGMSMAEAMSAGKPVVAYRINGAPEVVLDGVTGILVELGNTEELANAVVKILKDEELSKKMGKIARERALSLFDKEKTAERFLRIYREALAAKFD